MKTEKIIGIYCIQHRESGKRYIGKSVDIAARLKAHKYHLTSQVVSKHHTNRHLRAAVQKHGWDAFEVSIVERFVENNSDLLAERELFWMDAHKTCDRRFGYNLRRDSSSGMQVSEETRKLQAIATARVHRGMKRSAEARENMSKWQRGIPKGKQSEQHIAARMKALAGNHFIPTLTPGQRERQREIASRQKSAETRKKIVEAATGRILSCETRSKIAAARLGSKASVETRMKMSEAKRGRVVSEETRKRMSDAAKARWSAKRTSA